MRSGEIVGEGGGGGGAVLPYELDRYVLPDKVTMVSIIKQGIILSLLALCSWCDR